MNRSSSVAADSGREPRPAGLSIGRRAGLALGAAALALAPAAGGASAASVCYEAFTADTNARANQFLRLRTRAAGELVPANEGGAAAAAQTLSDVDGRFVLRTGLPLGQPQAAMHLTTGFVLVAPGKGAQMTLTRNFARGLAGPDEEGFHVLDCGSTTASATPATWVCRGVSATTGFDVLGARALRLSKVANPALVPDCRTFAGGAG
jgi:hypothetical protein